MCLVALAIGQSERFPWVLASNRDEFVDREAAPLGWWQPHPAAAPILSGRDLSAGGTWLGLNAQGRLALVTNVREPGRFVAALPSRGDLVLQGLQPGAPGIDPPAVLAVPRNGFNLLALDLAQDVAQDLAQDLAQDVAPDPAQHPAQDPGVTPGREAALWLSNRAGPSRRLQAGVYGLSNAALDTPWPKTQALKHRMQALLPSADSVDRLTDALLVALADRTLAADDELPATGVPLARERLLSSIFIRLPAAEAQGRGYGTRCSTVVVVERQAGGRVVHVLERRFDAQGEVSGQTALQFQPEPAAWPHAYARARP